MTTSTELVPFEVGDDSYLVPVWMKGLPYLSDERLEDMTIRHIYTARDLDTAMDEIEGAEKLAAHGGEVIEIQSAAWRPSEFKDSRWQVYAMFDAKLEDGSIDLFSCGAARVIAALDRACTENAFPLRCRVFVGDKKGAKHEMLGLVKLRDPFPDENAPKK